MVPGSISPYGFSAGLEVAEEDPPQPERARMAARAAAATAAGRKFSLITALSNRGRESGAVRAAKDLVDQAPVVRLLLSPVSVSRIETGLTSIDKNVAELTRSVNRASGR